MRKLKDLEAKIYTSVKLGNNNGIKIKEHLEKKSSLNISSQKIYSILKILDDDDIITHSGLKKKKKYSTTIHGDGLLAEYNRQHKKDKFLIQATVTKINEKGKEFLKIDLEKYIKPKIRKRLSLAEIEVLNSLYNKTKYKAETIREIKDFPKSNSMANRAFKKLLERKLIGKVKGENKNKKYFKILQKGLKILGLFCNKMHY